MGTDLNAEPNFMESLFTSTGSLRREKITKYIIVAGCLFWICVGVWGITSCYETAKEAKRSHHDLLSAQHFETAVPAILPNEKTADEEMQLGGFSGSPYLFETRLRESLLIFALCMVVSFFVLYTTLKMPLPSGRSHAPEDLHIPEQ